jgi:hypothetical protein
VRGSGAQRGQALTEYALILALTVGAFAVALELGVSAGWAQSLDNSRDGYYSTVDLQCTAGQNCADSAVAGVDTLRDQLELH